MIEARSPSRTAAARLARILAAAGAASALGAQATEFELVYTGAFSTTEALNLASDSSPDFFTAATPFVIRARFDDSTPNLAPAFGGPFDGFRAYAPSSVTIDIAGALYSVEGITANPTAGVAVAIFDQNSFMPGRYGVGLFADPVADGAGIVGDFLSASPDFSVDALTPTVFTEYQGAGHSSGVCLSGTPPFCPHAVTPWVLRDASLAAWNLTLGNFEEQYPAAPLNTARIIAVPEPATWGSMLAGLFALAGATRARLRRQRR